MNDRPVILERALRSVVIGLIKELIVAASAYIDPVADP